MFVGGCFGSFLNVVVYRLPRGASLSFPASHCPKCNHPIRFYDNIPVFGWLILRGRCRDCRESISVRYPAVEAISALIAGVIALAVFYTHKNISQYDLVVVTLSYFVLVMTFFAAGLIEFERNRIPLKIFIPALIIFLFTTYYLYQIDFYKNNKSNLLINFLSIIISYAVVLAGQQLYHKSTQPKSSQKTKSKKQKKSNTIFSNQTQSQLLATVTAVIYCGVNAIPAVLITIIAAILISRRLKINRFHLILTCTTLLTIIVFLARR
jgi:prepilin signal peptidase PulO-like enzyme (type II secretory pathway)